jgi:hypothetical protein
MENGRCVSEIDACEVMAIKKAATKHAGVFKPGRRGDGIEAMAPRGNGYSRGSLAFSLEHCPATPGKDTAIAVCMIGRRKPITSVLWKHQPLHCSRRDWLPW